MLQLKGRLLGQGDLKDRSDIIDITAIEQILELKDKISLGESNLSPETCIFIDVSNFKKIDGPDSAPNQKTTMDGN